MEWQPIETAPKDGRRFVARGIAFGDWGYTEDKTTEMFMRHDGDGLSVDQPTGRYFKGFKPARWIPLPDPPEAS